MPTKKITIIDYGLGNLGSIQNMLKKIGMSSLITSDPSAILDAEKLILPGVGAFDTGMRNLKDYDLIPAIEQKVLSDKIPILGICLGAHLMTQSSAEGVLPGLGWFNAVTEKFDFTASKKPLVLPSMGWREITTKKDTILLEGIEGARFYFVHAYYLISSKPEDISMMSTYGHKFAAALCRDNIYCVQFHPEKSHKFGKKLLQNFAGI